MVLRLRIGLTGGGAARQGFGGGGGGGRGVGDRWAGVLLVVPLVAFLLVFFAYPVASMLLRSVEPGAWSLQHYRDLLESDVFGRVMQITLEIGLIVTLCCLLLAYPLAYWLARLPAASANLFL